MNIETAIKIWKICAKAEGYPAKAGAWQHTHRYQLRTPESTASFMLGAVNGTVMRMPSHIGEDVVSQIAALGWQWNNYNWVAG